MKECEKWNRKECEKWNNVENERWNNVENETWNNVENETWNNVENQTWNNVENETWNNMENEIWSNAKYEAWSKMKDANWTNRSEVRGDENFPIPEKNFWVRETSKSWAKFDLDRAKLEARLNWAHNFHDLNAAKRSERRWKVSYTRKKTLEKKRETSK